MRSMPWEARAIASQGASKRSSKTRAAMAPGHKRRKLPGDAERLSIELVAAVVSVANDEPTVEVLPPLESVGWERLPSTVFVAGMASSLEDVLHRPVELQTGCKIGHMQQLHAFVGPSDQIAAIGSHILIGYLALVHDERRDTRGGAGSRRRVGMSRWQSCYQHLPWEDWRGGRPAIIDDVIIPKLAVWARDTSAASSKSARNRQMTERLTRIRTSFGGAGGTWDEEKVLTRYDLLVEAGLIADEVHLAPGAARRRPRAPTDTSMLDIALGRQLVPGHRRILAAAIGRLRSDLQARPVVFELMRDEFSLYELQRTVEAILGPNLHKQNFRRLIETAGLVEPTGRMRSHTGGRPAKLYRFRRDVLLERPVLRSKIRG